jgi:hypothetical protein
MNFNCVSVRSSTYAWRMFPVVLSTTENGAAPDSTAARRNCPSPVRENPAQTPYSQQTY